MVAPFFSRLSMSCMTDSDWAEMPHLICNQPLLRKRAWVANSLRKQISETETGLCPGQVVNRKEQKKVKLCLLVIG